MKFIMDTHIFLWALAEPQKLNHKQRDEIESAANTVYLSSISIAEIMIKASLGKLAVTFDPVKEAEQCGFTPLDFNGHAAIQLGALPFHHKDPFDRMLISQSLASNIAVMSDDSKFEQYPCRLV